MADAQDHLRDYAIAGSTAVFFSMLSPPIGLCALNAYFGNEMGWTLFEVAKGWAAQGVWTSLVVWGVWWPAWVLGGCVLFSGALRKT